MICSIITIKGYLRKIIIKNDFMKRKNKSFQAQALHWLSVAVVGVVVGVGAQFVSAWSNPGGAPPIGNVAGPLTTGSGDQSKTGGLALNGGVAVGLNDAVTSNDQKICLNGSCRTTWPSFTCSDYDATPSVVGWTKNTSHNGQEVCDKFSPGSSCVSATDTIPADGDYSSCNVDNTKWEDDKFRCCINK